MLPGTADFVGASWQPEMYRYRSRSASAESISRVLGRGASRRNVSGERSPGTHRSDPENRRRRTHRSPGTVGPFRTRFPVRELHAAAKPHFRRDSFDAATAALGLTITPHNLRDTAASLAIQAGASVVAVARLLGHESAATTLNHYAGLFPTDLDDVAIRLDAAAREIIGDQ